MKLVCHIGTAKTASTFLQNTCAANPKAMARRGLYYPDLLAHSANHITLFFAASRYIHDFHRAYGLKTQDDLARFRIRMKQQLAKQIAAAPKGTDTMVISSENLAGKLGNPGVMDLAALLKPLFSEVRILVYVRRQDEALLSLYAEAMRRGFSRQTFDTFVDVALKPKSTLPHLGYMLLLQRWEAAFGRAAITVRRFERGDMPEGDILADAIGQMSGDIGGDVSDFARSPESNPSLSAPALEYLRQIQAEVPFSTAAGINRARQALAPRINRLPTEPRPELSLAQSERITARYAHGNAWLREAYFPDIAGPLFPSQTTPLGEGNLGRLSTEEAAQFAALLQKA